MVLKELSNIRKCPDGIVCPAVFANEDGDFIFIGKNVDKAVFEKLKNRIGPNESIVFLPKNVVKCIKEHI
jgi:hypothetical protein